ncbi:MAG TPA: hypothetical protein VJA85_07535 [Candidatus Limnocylindria bacterium]|nr:hypothetical protein [Candidatus Limnocylindria bacterium]
MNETPQAPSRSGSPGATSVGVLLIGLGLLFFIGQQLGTDVTDWGWPLFVILPGLAILTVGLTQRSGPGLAIAGSIVTMIGLVLLFQKLYDAYQTWAYAWALVGPGGSGLGMLLYGTRSRDRKLARDGFWTVVTGLAIFAVGFIFFEGIIGLSGERWPLPAWVMPAAIVVIGGLVLLRGLTTRRAPVWDQPWTPTPPPPEPFAGTTLSEPAPPAEPEPTAEPPADAVAADEPGAKSESGT